MGLNEAKQGSFLQDFQSFYLLMCSEVVPQLSRMQQFPKEHDHSTLSFHGASQPSTHGISVGKWHPAMNVHLVALAGQF